jgi:hypothetical protein
MKTESFDILKEKLVKAYRKYGNKSCLFVMDAEGGKQFSGNQVADEIEQETPFGVNCIFTMLQLTIDLLSRDKMKYEPNKLYEKNIGKKVTKATQPFKSGFKINTVKSIIDHPILHIPAYTFEEDDSYVECRRCKVVEQEEESVVLSPSQVDNLLVLNENGSIKIGSTKVRTKSMNGLVEKGLANINRFANGEFWEITDKGRKEAGNYE